MKTAECHMRVFKSMAGGTWREKQTETDRALVCHSQHQSSGISVLMVQHLSALNFSLD